MAVRRRLRQRILILVLVRISRLRIIEILLFITRTGLHVLQEPPHDWRGNDVPDVIRVRQVLERQTHDFAVPHRGPAAVARVNSGVLIEK